MNKARLPIFVSCFLPAIAVVSATVGGVATSAAADEGSGCLSAGLARPGIVEAALTHPGDHYTQSLVLEIRQPELPPGCREGFAVAKPSFQFQLQDHLHHAHWVAFGPFRSSWHRPRRHGNLFTYWQEQRGHGEKQPISKSRLYQCSAGPAVTKVRAILKLRVVDLTTGKTAGSSSITVPMTVKRVRAKLKHRGALRGPC